MSRHCFHRTASLAIALCLAMPASGRGLEPAPQDPDRDARRNAPRPQRDLPQADVSATGIIRGRIVAADSGTPLRRALVRVNVPGLRGGRATTTNPDGMYELRELPPGRYRVTASKAGYLSTTYGQRQARGPAAPLELAEGQTSDHIDFSLPRAGVIVGRVVDELGEPVMDAMLVALAEVSVGGTRRLSSAGRQALTNDLGQFRLFGLPPGDYYVVATQRSGPGVESADDQGYGPTYFPNATSVSQAQRVRVAGAQEQAGIDIQMTPVRTATIAGIVLDSLGQPLTAGMVLLRPSGIDLRMPLVPGMGGRIDPSGAFTVPNVPPGDYLLVATSRPGMGGGGGRGGRGWRPPGAEPGTAGPGTEFAAVPVTVAGQDISGLTVMTTRGATVSGRIVFEEGHPPDLEPGRVRVSAAGGDLEDGLLTRGGTGTVRPDWTFEIGGLRGALSLRAAGLPAGWGVERILYGQTDVSDTGLTFEGPGEARDVEIVITNRLTEVEGTVLDARGEPAEGYSLVIFADDPARWTPLSRYVHVGAGSNGQFTVTGLPPGDYYAVALESLGELDPRDPEVLEQLSQSAARIALSRDDPRAVTLTIVAAPGP